MAAPSTSAIKIVNMSLYKGGAYSKIFLTATAVVHDITDMLSSRIRREVVRVSAYNREDSVEDETIGDNLKLKRHDSRNAPQQHNSAAEDGDGENARDIELSGSGRYFRQLIQIPLDKILQDRISELNIQNTVRVYFDAAMKCPMNLVTLCILTSSSLLVSTEN